VFGVIILFNLALENGFLRGRGVGKWLDLLSESVFGRAFLEMGLESDLLTYGAIRLYWRVLMVCNDGRDAG